MLGGSGMNKFNSFIVTLLTTEGDKSLGMTGEQILDLTYMLQTDQEPVPLYTQTEQYFIVGMLIQGRVFNDYPRVIVVTKREDEAE